MTDDEKKAHDALFNEIDSKIKSLVSEATKEAVKQSDVDKKVNEINEKIKGLSSSEVDALKLRVDELAKKNEVLENASKVQGAEMAKIKNDGGGKSEHFDLKSAIKEGILKYKDSFLEEVTDTYGTHLSMLKWFRSGKGKSPEFEIKDGSDIIKAVDMTTSAIAQSNVSALRLTELLPNVYGLPLAIYPHVLDYFPQRNIARPTMAMLVAYSYSDGADTKTEGSSSTQSSLLFKTVAFPAFAIYTYFTLTDEVLDDLDEALSEINRVAPDKIKSKLDSFVYRTTGDDSSAMKGMFAAAKSTAFVVASYASSVEGANYIDLIEAMISQCEDSDYVADTVGLNPVDIRLYFNSLKDGLDNSIRDNRLVFVGGKLSSVCGLRVVASNKITANTCYVGAINQLALLGVRKNLTLEIGLNGTDFVEGQKTARVGMRVAFGVGDPLGIIYCADMATDKNTIYKAQA